MLAIILLALCTLRGVDDGPFQLSVLPSEELGDEQFDDVQLAAFEQELAGLEIALEYEPIVPVTEIDALEAIESQLDLAPSMEGSLADLSGGSEGLGQGSGKVRTSVFGLAAEASTFVYVFDRSSSMNSTLRSYTGGRLVRDVSLLDLAKAELIRSLEPLTPSDQFQIVFYNTRPLLFNDDTKLRGLIPASPESKSAAEQFVLNMPGNGGTKHFRALEVGVALEPEVIFLITDGEAKDDPPRSLIRQLIRTCQKQGTQVHIIHFTTRVRPRCTLLPLAHQTGGEHRFMNLAEIPGL